MYPLKCFKSCLPQILLGPFSNTLAHIPLPISLPSFSENIKIIENLCKKWVKGILVVGIYIAQKLKFSCGFGHI